MQPYRSIEDVFAAGQHAIAEKATDKKLAGYLDAFVQGRLTTDTPEAIPSYEAQRDRLVAVVRKQRADGFGYHQTVNGEIAGVPKFFEVVLSMALMVHEIELVNVYYEKKEVAAGVSTARKIPCAEFIVTSNELKKRVDEPATPTAPPSIVPVPPQNTPMLHEGRVFKDGRLIFIAITGDDTYTIAQLEEGGSYDKFMGHVLAAENAGFSVSIEDIKALKGTLQSVKDLTELIRHSGFNMELKRAFFPTSKGGRIRFNSVAMLDDRQIEAVKRQAEKVKAKNRKQIASKIASKS